MAGQKRQRVRATRGPMTGSARLRTKCPGHPRLLLQRCCKDCHARNKPWKSPGMTNSIERIAAATPLRYRYEHQLIRKDARRKPAMPEFDPALHRMVPEQRWFEDFVL